MQKLASNKKGQGISMETIVIAVIVVAVLVVLLLVFTGRINIFGGDVNKCSSKGGGICANDCSNIRGTDGVPRTHANLGRNPNPDKNCNDQTAPGVTNGEFCCSRVGTEVDTTR